LLHIPILLFYRTIFNLKQEYALFVRNMATFRVNSAMCFLRNTQHICIYLAAVLLRLILNSTLYSECVLYAYWLCTNLSICHQQVYRYYCESYLFNIIFPTCKIPTLYDNVKEYSDLQKTG
jgi:hypothetical protein